ncbi:membrane lipoprotein lipid attachment site-containing protein [Neobacillus sp. PS3-40]|uniref:membrane lipoprotein lipid attachment site-containing protein n=1 Tax=Neobacillus sp. PS3-40 TaxID=3070679 RepID=UPI0027DF4C13|nr:membrane lipoprotein lipid attachment site-containing protein [Neobacillus sp. PS3-40]WML44309.1 membrane lipoprotein lipid attachment site-containing protein [Neobacillus sp. PS3-40]
MRKILAVLFTLLMLTACSDEKTYYGYIFKGESEHWNGEYSFRGTELWGEKDGRTTYSNENSYELVLKYKGTLKDFSSVKNLEYSYQTSTGGGSGNMEFVKPPKEAIIKSEGSSQGGARVSEDEVIKVRVKWNKHEETFTLRNNGK